MLLKSPNEGRRAKNQTNSEASAKERRINDEEQRTRQKI